MTEIVEKKCSKCGQIKPLEEFSGIKKKTSQCKKCQASEKRAIYKIHKQNYDVNFVPNEKKCSKCKEIKDVNQFHVAKGRIDGLSNYCKSCTKERMKKYIEKRRIYNRIYSKGYNIRKIKFKSTLECKQCNERDPYSLCFHHKDPSTKEKMNHQKPINKIKKEMEKYVVLCCNCHRKLHGWKRFVLSIINWFFFVLIPA